jgi:hypothetical protein
VHLHTSACSLEPPDIEEFRSCPWTPAGVLPAAGVTLPPDEYERHKAVYRAILNRRENGIDLIEDGVVFEHLRLCQMENGVVGDRAVR